MIRNTLRIAASMFALGLFLLHLPAMAQEKRTGAEEAATTSRHQTSGSLTDDATSLLRQVCLSAGRSYHSLEGSAPGAADHLFLEPDADASRLQADGQNWLLVPWPGREGWKQDPHCQGSEKTAQQAAWDPPNLRPVNWEEAIYNKTAYCRQLMEAWNRERKGKKPVRLCPLGPALLRLRDEIATGQVPGLRDPLAEPFYGFAGLFEDDVRLNAKGDYFLACVEYACMFGESPGGKVDAAGTGLSQEQAQQLARIAWEAVKAEPATGHVEPEKAWFPVAGSPHPSVPFEFYSPQVEVTITHSHADDEPTAEYASGLLLNRHVWPKRFLKPCIPVTRDSPGRDESPLGTSLPLAVFPKSHGDWPPSTFRYPTREGVKWGGELMDEVKKEDGRTLHQVQWDYLQMHVNRAYDHYIKQHQDIWPDSLDEENRWGTTPRHDRIDRELTPEYLEKKRAELTAYQKYVAVANYASGSHCRILEGQPWPSYHGVDVLFHNSHCAGSSKVALMMLQVAGFKTRYLGFHNHVSTEIKVNGKWVYTDRNVADGRDNRSLHGWAEITGQPNVFGYIGRGNSQIRKGRERCVYSVTTGMYWHHLSGISQQDPAFCQKGGMWNYYYAPMNASALYPTVRTHIWHIIKGEEPILELFRPRGMGHDIALKPGMKVRRRFWLSNCCDNPITAASAEFRVRGNDEGLVCSLDGHVLKQRNGNSWRLPVDLLTPGEHELVLHNTGTSQPELTFLPDFVRPYLNPVSGAPIEIRPEK